MLAKLTYKQPKGCFKEKNHRYFSKIFQFMCFSKLYLDVSASTPPTPANSFKPRDVAPIDRSSFFKNKSSDDFNASPETSPETNPYKPFKQSDTLVSTCFFFIMVFVLTNPILFDQKDNCKSVCK